MKYHSKGKHKKLVKIALAIKAVTATLLVTSLVTRHEWLAMSIAVIGALANEATNIIEIK